MINTLEYYTKNCRKIFDAVEQPNWRIWKIVDEDGSCRQNRKMISNPYKLLQFIKSCKNPKALYVSVSTFLNPHRNKGFLSKQKRIFSDRYIYLHAGYLIADCTLLDSYLFIDLDSEKDLKIAQKDARKIIRYLIDKPMVKLYKIQFSGSKGIHLIYKLDLASPIANPVKRIEHYKELKGAIVKDLEKLKLKTLDRTHKEIIKNNFAVYAAPYSIKSNGNVVTPLTYKEFMKKGIYHILSEKSGVNHHQLASEAKADDKKVATAKGKTLATQQYQVEERAGLSSRPIYFKFIDCMVNGLKDNYIVVIKKHKAKFKPMELIHLQKLYKLSDFYIMSIGDYIYAYNLKIVDFRRLVKILRKAKSENLSYLMTRRHYWMQLTPSIYKSGKLAQTMVYLGLFPSEYGQNDLHSRPHCNALGIKYPRMAGNQENKEGIMRVK